MAASLPLEVTALKTHYRIIAVIVTFHPDIECLRKLVLATLSQVAGIILVDNGSTKKEILEDAINSNSACFTEIISLSTNIGLAAAQNVGLARGKDLNATHFILFDQDSLPTKDMLAKLIEAEEFILAKNIKLAGVGPCYLDARQDNPPPFISVKGLALIRHPCTENAAPVEVDYLIASGFLMRSTLLSDVGNMREDLFIDYIDIEWGLRAKNLGFRSFGVCAAKMAHSLGDQPTVWMGRKIPMHSPLRHYYHFRNALLLYRELGISLNWKIVDASRLFLKFGYYTLFGKPRFEHFSSMLAGMLDGFFGKGGKKG
jgi:rhamnosyltransferase